MGPGSPDWFALDGETRATRVKAGRLRMVWAVRVNGATIYAKAAEHHGWSDRVKRLVVLDAGHREMRACVKAESRGLPVAVGLAVGRRDGAAGVTVFLSEGVADATPLNDAWSADVLCADDRRRRAVGRIYIDAVADLFAHAHEKGFLHGDAHPSNVLTTRDLAGRLSVTWIDLKAARFRPRPVSTTPSVHSLVQLDQYFHRRSTRTERLRFLKRYLAQRPSLTSDAGPSLREFARRLALERSRHNAALVARRDRRLRRRGPYFTTLTLDGGWTATVALRLERRHLFPERGVPDRRRKAWSVLVRSIIARVDETIVSNASASFETGGVFCEARPISGLPARLAATLLGSAHRALFERCHRQRHRDIDNELILGVVVRRRRGLVDLSVLIRPATDGKHTVHDGASRSRG